MTSSALLPAHRRVPPPPPVDISSLPQCPVCQNGCDCQVLTAGCEHFCCWGVIPDALVNTCPGARREAIRLDAAVAARS